MPRSLIQRVVSENGVVTYQSPTLAAVGVPHALSTRIGGISAGAFSSLNLGNPSGCPVQDSLANIAQNYELLQTAISCAGRTRAQVHQVHGCAVSVDRAGQSFDIHAQADAVVGDDPEKILSVRIADCVPILMADMSGRRVAAVHAGWRGVASGVVTAALKYFDNASRVHAAIGPAIGYEAFEVGEEVVRAVAARLGDDIPHRFLPDGKARIDLQGCLVRELVRGGVPIDQIDTTDRCTVTYAEEFFSHRRDNGITGRMAAMIGAIA
ncbi:MAG: peptidoglycan editing factor PgeF [Burkholderiales bacterium]|nr:peptidoglycan editing factor PgeF [Phycisphaerae bacterium]